ncbi:hypothetical protein ACOMHN_043149 [Nucella lapillus]
MKAVLVLILCLVEGAYGDCTVQKSLTICPYPLIVRPPKLSKVALTCTLSHGKLHTLEIGVIKSNINSIRFFYTVVKEGNDPPKRTTKSRTFVPESKFTLSQTPNSMTLTLTNVTVSDLDESWFCYTLWDYFSSGHFSFDHTFRDIPAIPFPTNTSFTASPSRPTYPGDGTVRLNCRGYSSLNLTYTTGKMLKFNFEYLSKEGYTTVPDEHIEGGLVAGVSFVNGDFITKTYSIKLRMSSIPGCARQYRCRQSYKKQSWVEQAGYLTIDVQPCTGSCKPGGACDKTETPTTTKKTGGGMMMQMLTNRTKAMMMSRNKLLQGPVWDF